VTSIGERWRAALVVAWCSVVVACGVAWGGEGPFALQALAVSDADRAVAESRALIEAGFPAYVARGVAASGEVYRVRIGAFGDRELATRFAALLPDVARTRPVPVVAEAFPEGMFPVVAQLAWAGTGEVRIVPWSAGVVLRQTALDGGAALILLEGDALRLLTATPAPQAAVPPSDVPFVDLAPAVPADAPADAPAAHAPSAALLDDPGTPLPEVAIDHAGLGWRAASAEGFVTLASGDGAPWRAAVGTLVWGEGAWLLVRAGDEVLLLRIVAR
jgi:hypothetical protein